MTTEELENYVPKGELTGFPKEIIARMLDCQVEQGYKNNILVFEKSRSSGFSWNKTKEGCNFWFNVIKGKNFNLFFKRYPKKEDNSQEFKVGDRVIDIMCKSSGIITNVSIGRTDYPLTVELENGKIINTYTIDGRLNSYFEKPQLLHLRDDYNYDMIDFNNLPQRQEVNRWRAEEDGVYYFVNFHTDGWFFCKSKDDHDYPIDNNNYNSGNYFRTEVEAEIIAQKLNKYFQELINKSF